MAEISEISRRDGKSGDRNSEEQSSGGGEHFGEAAGPKKSKVKKSEALWLMSFSDLSMILIAFFILQLSYSTVDKKKLDNVQTAMDAKPSKDDNLKSINEKLIKEVKRLNLDKSAEVRLDAAGLSIEFKDGVLFPSGSANANPKFTEVVGSVMKLIGASPDKYHIVIEGHTDDTPIRTKDFQSNWELSAARGFTLMRRFLGNGVAENRMSVEAFAHTRPKITTAGLSGDELTRARSANRRVVIRVE